MNNLFKHFFEKYQLSLSEKELQEIIDLVAQEKSDAKSDKLVIQEIFDYYNQNKGQMPKAELLSATRQSAIKKRVKEFGIDKVKEVILLSSRSQFMNGYNPQSWKASLDWIIKPANFIKILEGNYKNKVNEFTTGQQQQPIAQPRRNR